MAFRLPFMKQRFSSKEQEQMKIIHHFYKSILERDPNATDCVLALQNRTSYSKPLQNPDVKTDFDGMSEVRKLKRHGNLRELVITILPRICEWQKTVATGTFTGYANEPINLLLEEFKIWMRSLADKLQLDDILLDEVKKRIEFLNALQERSEFMTQVQKLQGLESRCDLIMAEIKRSIGRTTLHDKLKKIRNLVKCMRSDLSSFLFYIIRSQETKSMFDMEDLKHKDVSACDKGELMLCVALNYSTIKTEPAIKYTAGNNSTGASHDMMQGNPFLITDNSGGDEGGGNTSTALITQQQQSTAVGVVRQNSSYLVQQPTVDEDGDEEVQFGPNPFFQDSEMGTAETPKEVNEATNKSGLYGPVKDKVEAKYTEVHAILFQVGDFIGVLGKALDVALLGDVVVYSFANKLFCEIIDRGIRLLKQLISAMHDMQKEIKKILQTSVAKKQKLDKKWNQNRLKAQPFANSVLAQTESSLAEMAQIMQIVTGVRLGDMAAKAKQRMVALLDYGSNFCQSTSLLCDMPKSEVFTIQALEEEVKKTQPNELLKARLTYFYQRHNKGKASSVEEIMENHKGQEQRLWKRLAKKYGEKAVQDTWRALPGEDDEEVIFLDDGGASMSSNTIDFEIGGLDGMDRGRSGEPEIIYDVVDVSSPQEIMGKPSDDLDTDVFVKEVAKVKGWPENVSQSTIEKLNGETLLKVKDLRELAADDWKELGLTLGVRKALRDCLNDESMSFSSTPLSSSPPVEGGLQIDPVTGLIIGDLSAGRVAMNPVTGKICHVDTDTSVAQGSADVPANPFMGADEEEDDTSNFILSHGDFTREQDEKDMVFRNQLIQFYSKYNPEQLEGDVVERTVANFRGKPERCMEILRNQYQPNQQPYYARQTTSSSLREGKETPTPTPTPTPPVEKAKTNALAAALFDDGLSDDDGEFISKVSKATNPFDDATENKSTNPFDDATENKSTNPFDDADDATENKSADLPTGAAWI